MRLRDEQELHDKIAAIKAEAAAMIRFQSGLVAASLSRRVCICGARIAINATIPPAVVFQDTTASLPNCLANFILVFLFF